MIYRVYTEYKFNKTVLHLSFLSFGIYYYFLNITNLPDYEAYELIYNTKGLSSFSLSSWEPLFAALNYMGHRAGLSYDQFRHMILFICLFLLYMAFNIIINKEIKKLRFVKKENIKRKHCLGSRIYNLSDFQYSLQRFSSIQVKKSSLLFSFLFIFSIVIFMFEYYAVRIRAGLSVSVLLFSLALLWPNVKNKLNILLLLEVFVLWSFASLIHFFTFVIFMYLVFMPFFIAKLFLGYAFMRRKVINLLVIPLFLFVLSIFFMIEIISSVELRGEHLYSTLNVVRFLAMAVMPVILFLLFFTKEYVVQKDFKLLPKYSALNYRGVFYYFLTLNYFTMLLTLIVFFCLGLLDNAGEAVVRVYTLASSIAYILIFISQKKYLFFWINIALVNSLFFLNTIYG